MANGKLEARITFTTAQVMTVAITAIGGSPFTVTVAAGSYFPTALLTELQTQLDAASGADGAFTVSASIGESGTGLVTISHTVETITITWADGSTFVFSGFATDWQPGEIGIDMLVKGTLTIQPTGIVAVT